MNGAERHVLAVDIGGTKINAAIVDAASDAEGTTAPPLTVRGPVLRCATPAAQGALAVVDAAQSLGRTALTETGVSADAVGVATAGIVDLGTGTITHATDALPGWPGTALTGSFTEAFGRPCAVLNDVHAHGLGEALLGAGCGQQSLLMIAIGTGIGGAFIRDGEVLAGTHGAAGHVGHLPCPEAGHLPCACGRTGHLEAIASGPGIAAAYARRSPGGTQISTRRIAELAASDDALAIDVLHTAGIATGRMIGGMLNVLDPSVVAVTGGVSLSGPVWWQALHEGIHHDAMGALATTPVVEATAGNHAALLGAAHHALELARTG